MRVRVCSGFSPAGRIQYGERFVRTFDQYWPASTELQVYVEEPTPMPRNAERSLWHIPGAAEFHHRHEANLAVQGRVPQPCWKARDVQRGYSFKTDAYKFWKQIMIPLAASNGLNEGDVLVWLDGDVETVAPVPETFVPRLIEVADVVFLGRAHSHSEIGFWALRMCRDTEGFLRDLALMYRTDRFIHLPEWHSAFVWDHVRASSGLIERNLCGPSARGHVWPLTALARYTRHDKGQRKPNA